MQWSSEGTVPRLKVLFKRKGQGFNPRGPHRWAETRYSGARGEEGTVQILWECGGGKEAFLSVGVDQGQLSLR